MTNKRMSGWTGVPNTEDLFFNYIITFFNWISFKLGS